MSCTRHFMNIEWEHHSWRPHVSSSEHLAVGEMHMWGREVNGEYVVCHKQEVCEVCGLTRGCVECICDTAHAERCRLRRAWVADSHHAE